MKLLIYVLWIKNMGFHGEFRILFFRVFSSINFIGLNSNFVLFFNTTILKNILEHQLMNQHDYLEVVKLSFQDNRIDPSD